MRERFGISGNVLKIIAALSMLLDHVGYMFFPGVEMFRIIGRLAFPIFAFMIAEGCRYTRNKLRYFLMIFSLAFICQLVYFIYDGDTYMSVLVTFSLSILTVYALQFFKDVLCYKNSSIYNKIFAGAFFLVCVICVYVLNLFLEIDYGFFGCVLPVFASLFHVPKGNNNLILNKLDNKYLSLLSLSLGLLFLAVTTDTRQYFALLAIPFLLIYSGKRGKANIKYFFYIFYPAHLLVLEFINMII